jgi:hypothetical protein
MFCSSSFRSTKANPQDFIPHMRYFSNTSRNTTAVAVRARRDKWLATMLDKARQDLPLHEGSMKSVAEMLLTDNQQGLTTRMFSNLMC